MGGASVSRAPQTKDLMAALLFGVSPRDPLVFVAVSVLLGTVTISAVWIPARRSIRVQPMTALRAD